MSHKSPTNHSAAVKKALTLFAAALAHHQAGRLHDAEPLYEEGLQHMPENPDALFLLGQVLFESGRREEGEALSRRAIALQPLAKYWYGLALQLFNRSDYAAAHPAFAEALQQEPAHPDYRRGLSRTLEQLGDLAAALALWQNAPAALHGEARYQNARLLHALGRTEDALNQLVGELPTDHFINRGDWYALRAQLYEQQNDTENALQDRLHAIAANPQDALLRGQLAVNLMQQGLFNDALGQFVESVRLAPHNGQLHFNYGLALARLGQFAKARSAYTTAIAHTSALAQAPILTNLANLLSEETPEKSLSEAYALYQQAISCDPSFAPAHYNLGMWYLDEGQRLDATAALARAAELDPNNGLITAHLAFQQMHLCQWHDLARLEQKIFDCVAKDSADIPPFIVLTLPHNTAEIQLRASENHARRLAKPLLVDLAPVRCVQAEHSGRRLRLGYLSSDFKNHATVHLMIEMLEAHQRSVVEVFALSYSADDQSTLRARLIASVEHFIELSDLPESQAVQRIAALNLDILIDLKGYTEGNRSAWLRYRLAPIQINWLGYPGSVGAPWADYLIADRTLIPSAQQTAYSEKILYLPHTYQPNARHREVTRAPLRTDEGLPDDALVLCSFNQTYKITPALFACWLAVLHKCPQAVLWLWASNPWAETELRRHATNAGLAANRLIFAASRAQAAHLARLPLADLALDTFPCNGHTTTSDALWAGVPVITLQGETLAARVAASLLQEAALGELIYDDYASYQQGIVRFCQDTAWRADIKTRTSSLRETSPLFDAPRFAHQLENLLLELSKYPPNEPSPP